MTAIKERQRAQLYIYKNKIIAKHFIHKKPDNFRYVFIYKKPDTLRCTIFHANFEFGIYIQKV